MNPLSAIKSAISILKEKSQGNVKDIQETNKKYGSSLSSAYNLSGGKPVQFAQKANDFLKKRNLPGQVITGELAKKSASEPLNIARSKMAMRQDLTPQEKKMIESAGLGMVAGVTSPLKSELTPGTRAFQDLRNEVFQLRLKNNQNFMNKGQIDLDALGGVEELAQRYLSKQAMNLVKRNNGPGARTGAYLDELEVLTQ